MSDDKGITKTGSSEGGSKSSHSGSFGKHRGRAPSEIVPERRRIAKAALIGAPILLTLPGQALHAAVPRNCTLSGWASANVSGLPEGDCEGLDAQHWSSSGNNADSNRAASADQNAWVDPNTWEANVHTPFDSPYGFPGAGTGDLTMLQALSTSDHYLYTIGNFPVIRSGAAALLNAKYTPGYPLSEAMVRKIVLDTLHYGSYTTSGVELDAYQVHKFLENTMSSTAGVWDQSGF